MTLCAHAAFYAISWLLPLVTWHHHGYAVEAKIRFDYSAAFEHCEETAWVLHE